MKNISHNIKILLCIILIIGCGSAFGSDMLNTAGIDRGERSYLLEKPETRLQAVYNGVDYSKVYDYSYYIVFHFQILYRCYKEINQRLDDLYINDKRVNKKKRIENLIFNSVLPISKAEIQDKLPDVSVTTIEKVLSDLLKQNSIKKIGNYKDAKYIWLSTDENS